MERLLIHILVSKREKYSMKPFMQKGLVEETRVWSMYLFISFLVYTLVTNIIIPSGVEFSNFLCKKNCC